MSHNKRAQASGLV